MCADIRDISTNIQFNFELLPSRRTQRTAHILIASINFLRLDYIKFGIVFAVDIVFATVPFSLSLSENAGNSMKTRKTDKNKQRNK